MFFQKLSIDLGYRNRNMTVTDNYVLFWGDEPFTNFTFCPNLEFLGLKWKSTEQLFMWLKAVEFKDFEIATRIRQCITPKEAKKCGRAVKNFDAKHWSEVSYKFMKQIVDIKFRTNPSFFAALINPMLMGKTFVEASPYDKVWGIGYDEHDALTSDMSTWGENRLGKILTELRDQYITEIYGNLAGQA